MSQTQFNSNTTTSSSQKECNQKSKSEALQELKEVLSKEEEKVFELQKRYQNQLEQAWDWDY